VLCIPLGPGTAHVVQFRPVGVEDGPSQREPKRTHGDAQRWSFMMWGRHLQLSVVA